MTEEQCFLLGFLLVVLAGIFILTQCINYNRFRIEKEFKATELCMSKQSDCNVNRIDFGRGL